MRNHRSVKSTSTNNWLAAGSQEAERELLQAIELAPDLPIAHYFLGQTLLLRDEQRAVQHLSAAVKLSPDTPEFRVQLGNALLKQGKLDQAVSMLREGMRQNPSEASAHYILARALQRTGHESEASTEFREAARLTHAKHSVEEAGLLTINGIKDLRGGNIQDAITNLRKALERTPDYAEAHYYLGIALAQAGDADGDSGLYGRAQKKAAERGNSLQFRDCSLANGQSRPSNSPIPVSGQTEP